VAFPEVLRIEHFPFVYHHVNGAPFSTDVDVGIYAEAMKIGYRRACRQGVKDNANTTIMMPKDVGSGLVTVNIFYALQLYAAAYMLALSRTPTGSLGLIFTTKPAFPRHIHVDLRVAAATRHVIDAFAFSIDIAFDNAIVRWRSLGGDRF